MQFKKSIGMILAGLGAGAVNGLFGAGGGMVLVPLLTLLPGLDDEEIFPSSVCIILPICIISLVFSYKPTAANPHIILIYLIGSTVGGIIAGFVGKKLPTTWLHKFLGILILWGGLQYLC